MTKAAYLAQQLTQARNELNNLRKNLRGLQAEHRKEMSQIKEMIIKRHSSTPKIQPTNTDHESSTPGDMKLFQDWQPIGHIKSWFRTKNGTPRQGSVSSLTRGVLNLSPHVFNNPHHALQGLEQFSHVWILFVFDKNEEGGKGHRKSKVAPPRLGGQRVGVFGTRSPHRPNPLGLTLARLDKVEGGSVHLSGLDILDGTPVLDIKPYILQYDAPPVVVMQFEDPVSSLPPIKREENAFDPFSILPQSSEVVEDNLDQLPHLDSLSSVSKECKYVQDNLQPQVSSSQCNECLEDNLEPFSSISQCNDHLQQNLDPLPSVYENYEDPRDSLESLYSSYQDNKSLEDNLNKFSSSSNSNEVLQYNLNPLPSSKSNEHLEPNLTPSTSIPQSNKSLPDHLEPLFSSSQDRKHFQNNDNDHSGQKKPAHHKELKPQCESEAACRDVRFNEYGTTSQRTINLNRTEQDMGLETNKKSDTRLSEYDRSYEEENGLETSKEFCPRLTKCGISVCIEEEGDTQLNESVQHVSLSSNVAKKKVLPRSEAQGSVTEISHEQRNKEGEVIVAPWIAYPVTGILQVLFNPIAQKQIEKFSCQAHDEEYRLEYLTSSKELREAIESVLMQDPRSVYRRSKCPTQLYYLSVDTAHITAWFEGDCVEVLRVQPLTTQSHIPLRKALQLEQ